MRCPAQVNVDGTLYGCDVQHDQPPPRVHVSGPGHASWGEGYALIAAPVVAVPEAGERETNPTEETNHE